jgi:hypothetical protein
MEKGKQKRVLTPRKNKRRNTFITLLWPERKNGLFFNTYPKRRSKEFKHHLSNVLQHAKRLGAKKIIVFVDHATCHKSPGTKRFIRNHKSILKVKLLAKRAPRLNPVEGDVNRPLKSFVRTNKSHPDIEAVVEETRSFLRNYRRTLGT